MRADLNIVEETKIIEYNLVGEQVTTEVYYNRLPDLSELSKYMGVCWFTGDDEETSLIAEEQPLISSYLPVNIRMVKIT